MDVGERLSRKARAKGVGIKGHAWFGRRHDGEAPCGPFLDFCCGRRPRCGGTLIRAPLEHLKPVVRDGGYIPIPDHRIPPSCSLAQYRTYVRVFKDVFRDLGSLSQ